MAKNNFSASGGSASGGKIFGYLLITIFLTLGLSISFQSLLAWTAPLANPPICLPGNPGCDADTLQIVTARGNSTSAGLVINGQTLDHQTDNFFYLNSSDGLQLRINADNSGTAEKFQINNSANATVFTVTDAGNVGLGTTGPGYKLDLVDDRNGLAGIRVSNPNTGTSAQGRIVFQSADSIGIVSAYPSTYNNPAWADRVALFSDSSAAGVNLVSEGVSSDIRFMTGGNQSTNERMRINAVGNVGIGTTNPSTTLDVSGTFRASGLMNLNSGTAANNTIGGNLTFNRADSDAIIAGPTNLNLLIRRAGTGNVALVDNGGNVGLGTTTPSRNLEIYGSGNAVLRLSRGANNAWSAVDFQPTGSLSSTNVLWGTGLQANTTNYNIWTYDGVNSIPRFSVTNSGTVGIGTTGPDVKLTISDGTAETTTNPNAMLKLVHTTGPQLMLIDAGTTVGGVQVVGANMLFVNTRTTGGAFRFRSGITETGNWETTGTEQMTITTEGNVGIGTVSPKSRLQINGDMQINDANHAAACDNDHKGAIKYENDHFYGCRTTGWVQLDNALAL